MLEFNNNWGWVFFVAFGIAFLIQLYYYIFVFGKLAIYKVAKPETNLEFPPVSVIISARNEYRNLEENLPILLNQDYPDYEVIVVNDCSWDDSQKLLEYYQETHPRLKICKLIEQEKYPTGKKFALTIGIKAALHENLFFTDADCRPGSQHWLKTMQTCFLKNQNTQIILGYSPQKKYKGFLNIFIRYETVLTAMAYLSAALLKRPFMGVGRNLAYTKTLFFKHKGFASHQHIICGDDDLFVNQAATPLNVTIQIHPDAFMVTEPKRKFTDWISQKTRHIHSGKYYKPTDKIFLGAYYFSLLLFYALLFPLYFFGLNPVHIGIAYSLRLLVQIVIYFFILKKLKSIGIIWFIPILDLLYLIYIWIFGIRGLFVRDRKIW
jgi:glycosyltransferase involved in cell wall biosynthesis